MDHSTMDHSAHMMAHTSGMDMGNDRCSMNMLFTWSTRNLCIIFSWWHIRGPLSLLISLLSIIILTASFEALRSVARRYELSVSKRMDELPHGQITESTPFLSAGRNQGDVSRRAHFIKAGFYAVQSFYGFMLMLLFMTYNGWVMAAMFVGAFLGYSLFGNNTTSTKDGACH